MLPEDDRMIVLSVLMYTLDFLNKYETSNDLKLRPRSWLT